MRHRATRKIPRSPFSVSSSWSLRRRVPRKVFTGWQERGFRIPFSNWSRAWRLRKIAWISTVHESYEQRDTGEERTKSTITFDGFTAVEPELLARYGVEGGDPVAKAANGSSPASSEAKATPAF